MRYKACDSPRGPIYVTAEYYCKDCPMYEPLNFVAYKRDENGDYIMGENGPIEEGICISCSHRSACKLVVNDIGKRIILDLEKQGVPISNELKQLTMPEEKGEQHNERINPTYDVWPVHEAYRLVCDILDSKLDKSCLEDVRGYLEWALDKKGD